MSVDGTVGNCMVGAESELSVDGDLPVLEPEHDVNMATMAIATGRIVFIAVRIKRRVVVEVVCLSIL